MSKKKEMNLYKRCKNIFKSHGVDMGGGGAATVLEFIWEAKGENAGEEIVRTDLTWQDIANAIKSNPSTVAHVIYPEGSFAIFPVIMFSENERGGAATFGSGGVLFGGTTEDGSKKWMPCGGTLSVNYDSETGEMVVGYVNNFGP